MKISQLFNAKFYLLLFLFSFSLSYGEILAEGKTKIVKSYPEDFALAIFEAKDDITAFNKAKHDILKGKAEYATATTCNVFRFLKDCGIPVAFKEQIDSTSFLGNLCEMIPYEVVVRREAHGSYLKRHPNFKKGDVFPKLIVEFFLKTSDHVWKGISIPADDPYLRFEDGRADVYLPDVPIESQKPFMTLIDYPLKHKPELLEEIALTAKKTFLVLEKAWQLNGGKLVDFKVEFGIDAFGNLLLADVIDNDSWRVVQDQEYIDKQVYRDGGALDKVTALYRYVSIVTGNFNVPKQQIVLWQEPGTDLNPVLMELAPLQNEFLKIAEVTSSVESSPMGSYRILYEKVSGVPDSVVISSIEVEPSLSSFTTLPVIPALDVENATLSALQILAMKNPFLYMHLRLKLEEDL